MDISIVILAAGQGTRMKSKLPKVLQPLAKRPLLGHVVDCAKATGADDICVVYGFAGDMVQAAFANADLRWAEQAEQLGTGHAVMQAMPATPDANRVIVLYGDVPLLSPNTLKNLLNACAGDDVAVLTVDMADPYGYGRIVRERGQVVRSIEEKDASPDERKITEINTGVLTCTAARLKDWLGRLTNDNSQGEYYLTDVIALAADDGVNVHGVEAASEEEVMGINDKSQLADAERALQRQRVEALMANGVGFADPCACRYSRHVDLRQRCLYRRKRGVRRRRNFGRQRRYRVEQSDSRLRVRRRNGVTRQLPY